jgi:hypothetical protein
VRGIISLGRDACHYWAVGSDCWDDRTGKRSMLVVDPALDSWTSNDSKHTVVIPDPSYAPLTRYGGVPVTMQFNYAYLMFQHHISSWINAKSTVS